jgi:hypothetical protein
LTFTNSLVNTGGEGLSYSLDTLPGWLSASPMSGTLLPRTPDRHLHRQLADRVRSLLRDLYADVPGYGREPLECR